MNLCVNSKLGTVFLSSKECSNDAHTSQHIYAYVEGCIVDVGPENVVQIVTDNASNNMGAAKLLKEKRPTIFWTSCATHTINLMLEGIGGIDKYKTTLEKAKKLTVFIYAHHKTLALMRHYTKKRDIVRPGVTRFASAYLTLQSIHEKKSQLRQMFGSDDWDKCKLAKTAKGNAAYETVVLRMVDADWKPSMGFLYGELKKAKEEIKVACNNNSKVYEPLMDVIRKKMQGRLDTILHMAAYFLNPFYLYNNLEVQDDVVACDAVVQVVETLYPEDFVMQDVILNDEFPVYKANWWSTHGTSTPNLRKIAMRILSLTTSSSGCERNWSIFEGVHTKKRNRLEAVKLNNLVYVQFNANLMERNIKRKSKDHEVLLAQDQDATEAQEWIVDEEAVAPRELDEDDFESQSEDEIEDEEFEYESDRVQIVEQYGPHDDEV